MAAGPRLMRPARSLLPASGRLSGLALGATLGEGPVHGLDDVPAKPEVAQVAFGSVPREHWDAAFLVSAGLLAAGSLCWARSAGTWRRA